MNSKTAAIILTKMIEEDGLIFSKREAVKQAITVLEASVKRYDLDELLSEITDENRHEEMIKDIQGRELL